MAGIAFSPPNGWGSFAVRGDVSPQNMLACSNPAGDAEPHRIYSIDLRTGEAQELFAADAMPTPGKPYCDGLAWDPLNDTIYMSSDISNTVYHDTSQGKRLRTLTVPSDCFVAGVSGNSGIVVVGPHLFLACNRNARASSAHSAICRRRLGGRQALWSSEKRAATGTAGSSAARLYGATE